MTASEWWWLAAIIVAGLAALLRLVAARPVRAPADGTLHTVRDVGHLAGALAAASVALLAAGLLALP